MTASGSVRNMEFSVPAAEKPKISQQKEEVLHFFQQLKYINNKTKYRF
jgi:hypothetical protein